MSLHSDIKFIRLRRLTRVRLYGLPSFPVSHVLRHHTMSSGAAGFTVNRIIAGTECRIGSLRLPHSHISTPSCLQYTRSAALPHIEWQQADQHLDDDEAPILIPADSIVKLTESLAKIGTSLADFARIPRNRPVFLTTYDYLRGIPHGMNDCRGIATMTVGGRVQLSPEMYNSMITAVKPNLVSSLCDSDAPPGSSRKRVSHTVERSSRFLDHLISNNFKQSNGHRSDKSMEYAVFGNIEGGWVEAARMDSVTKVLEKSHLISGYVIEGLTDSSALPASNKCPSEYIKSVSVIISDVLKLLPHDKPRALFGPLKPELIWHFACLGIDLFDSSYATQLAESGQALFIQLTKDSEGKVLHVSSNEITLGDKNLFKEDFSIIDELCACYTCRAKFTKAYICHLIDTREILASTLLLHHNLHALYSFFREIRRINVC